MKYIKFLSVLWMSLYIVGCGASFDKNKEAGVTANGQESSVNNTTSSRETNNNINEENNTNKKPTRVACVGDSITEGHGLPNPKNDSYPSKLQDLLGKSYEVKNFGKSNKTLMKNGDDPYWNHEHYNNSLVYKPEVVIIMLGTNDVKPSNWEKNSHFVKDYSDLIKKYKELDSQPIIYICKPPPSYGKLAGITNAKIREMKVKIEEVAGNNSFVKVIDVYSKMLEHREWFRDDALHPNKLGAEELANIIYKDVYQ